MKVYIIGASFAGVSCAMHARKLYPEAEIIIIEKNGIVGFLPGGLLLHLQDKFKSLDDAVFTTEEQLKEQNIKVKLSEKLLDCAPEKHEITTTEDTYHYDKLVLANGSEQKSLNIGLENDDEWDPSFKNYDLSNKILPKIQKAATIAIIGAGQAGMEAASTFVDLKKEVHLIEAMDYPLFKYFDPNFLKPFLTDLQKIPNLQFYFNTTVSEVTENGHYEIFLDEQKITSDYVLTTVNVHPQLAQFAKRFQLHSDNTVQTDNYLETSAQDVFAVGDLIHSPIRIREEGAYLPQINHAIRSGVVAAENLQQTRMKFKGGLRTIGTKIFGWYLASTGLIEEEAFVYSNEIATKSFTQSASLVDDTPVFCKAVFEKSSKKLLGIQLLSQVNCLEKINTAALAIESQVTLTELMQNDYFFQPEFTNLMEPFNRINMESGDQNAF
ncbi:oxidoreductase [Tetragenococcus osmophilus]|uniref:Oxidoreductase n=2 Tax=Tetragenococcus osmophilus TaxID=526944 RepID=A0ABN5QYE8_9ENTE|nr:FAD/NAD(P)-binding oxidoreductase [Tetragenococcus osmophilus]AYW48807.1 oxidoreductase [Tetragenococcus osmophilus]